MAQRHLFVCCNGRSSGKPACGPRGGDALVAAVQRELLARGAIDVLITTCGCLGPCFDGPNAVIYPDAAWYSDLTPDDAAALADHLVSGRAFAAKLSQRPGSTGDRAEDSGGDGGDGGNGGDDRPATGQPTDHGTDPATGNHGRGQSQ